MARENSQKKVPKPVELPSSNLCVTSIGASIFILTLNHADVIGDQSDAVTQNAWFHCALCAAIPGEISILIQNEAETWGRFPVPRICLWESKLDYIPFFYIKSFTICADVITKIKFFSCTALIQAYSYSYSLLCLFF